MCRGHEVICGERTLIMGILNATPDSFSDGGQFLKVEQATARALKMLEEGADLIDIGGESTRPGATAVPADEEMARTIPIIKSLRQHSNCLISIDTMKASVARAAIEAGANVINDVTAFSDPDMVKVAAETGAGIVLMHMKGSPKSMQNNPTYDNPVDDVVNYLKERMAYVLENGVAMEQLVLDPGIGFGKKDDHNVALLNGIQQIDQLGRPVLIGVSRKSLIGRLTGSLTTNRLAGSVALVAASIDRGAQILRVHDVKESCDAAKLVDRLLL